MGVKEVGVFGDNDTLLDDRKLVDDRVLRRISRGKIESVGRVVAILSQHGTESAREVRIDEKVHVRAR